VYGSYIGSPSTPEIGAAQILSSPLWGKVMQDYETRVMGRTGKVSLIAPSRQLSDFAAIRAAKKLSGNDQYVEVWRDDVCVYSERSRSIRLVWPVSSDKALG
jgi:hypothetical protein